MIYGFSGGGAAAAPALYRCATPVPTIEASRAQAMPPCWITAQARAQCRAVLGTGTRQAVPGRFQIELFRTVPMPAR